MREGTASRVMAADRPCGEFYDFYSVSPQYFGYTLYVITLSTWCNIVRKIRRFSIYFFFVKIYLQDVNTHTSVPDSTKLVPGQPISCRTLAVRGGHGATSSGDGRYSSEKLAQKKKHCIPSLGWIETSHSFIYQSTVAVIKRI
jgi:hypothetical protein